MSPQPLPEGSYWSPETVRFLPVRQPAPFVKVQDLHLKTHCTGDVQGTKKEATNF